MLEYDPRYNTFSISYENIYVTRMVSLWVCDSRQELKVKLPQTSLARLGKTRENY